jgi:hypothetical protein
MNVPSRSPHSREPARAQTLSGAKILRCGKTAVYCDKSQSHGQLVIPMGVVARIRRGLAFGQEEAVEGWFVKLPSGFPSDAEQAQRRSPASFREDEIQGQELGFL